MSKKAPLILIPGLLLFVSLSIGGCTSSASPTNSPEAIPDGMRISGTAKVTLNNSPIMSSTPSVTTTIESSPTSTRRPTSTGRPVPSRTPTPIPTLSREESGAYTLNLLSSNGGCVLPCVWGITPGQTIITDTFPLFTYLGWKGGYFYLDDMRKNYETGSGETIEDIEVLISLGVTNNIRLM